MTRNMAVMIYLVLMIGVIVGADLLFFRHDYSGRLIANVCIVLVFAAFYLRYLRVK